jgi:iduronate 2-sulfatase
MRNTKDNYKRVVAVLAFVLPLSGLLAASAEVSAPKPNILFLIADDLAPRLGCYGDKAAITPNLDRLAREGVLFNRAYAQGSVCIPSRTSFMLGLNNRHAGADHFKRNPETMTLGRWFRQHGYQTFSVGKIMHDETYVDPKAWDVRVPSEQCKPPGPGKRLVEVNEEHGEKRRFMRYSVYGQAESLQDWARTERALQFFEKERDPQKPFFAAVGFHTAHDPHYSIKRWYDALDKTRMEPEWPPPTAGDPVPPSALHHVPDIQVSEAEQRECKRLYYAAVSSLDQQVGRLLDQLRAKGLLDNTVVVFTSDQGYHLGWRGQWAKHTISEQVLRVPLIVRGGQAVKGRKADGIVELLDLFPTFCELAGLPTPAKLDGKSFLPLLKDPTAEGKPAAFCSMPVGWGNGRTVRTLRWRLIERLDGSRELYDHGTDTREYQNLINKPEHAELVARLHGMLEKEFGPLKIEKPIL